MYVDKKIYKDYEEDFHGFNVIITGKTIEDLINEGKSFKEANELSKQAENMPVLQTDTFQQKNME